MWERVAVEILAGHRGKLIGAVLGLVISLMVLRFGFWWTTFIVVSTFTGYHIGRRLDEGKETLLEIVDRYLPGNDR